MFSITVGRGATLGGYCNLTLKRCGATDPQLKKLGNVVSSSHFQSLPQSLTKSDNLGGDGGSVVVCKKNQCNNKSQ